MNLKNILIAVLFIASMQWTHAQGIEFFEGSWDDAKMEAAKNEKLIFVDAYTSWCGPCRKLKKVVFPQKKAGDFFNKHFISLSLDLEKRKGLIFSLYYDIRAYPTLLYMDANGDIIKKDLGFRDVHRLVKEAGNVIDLYYNPDKLEEKIKVAKSNKYYVKLLVNALYRQNKDYITRLNKYIANYKLSKNHGLRLKYECLVTAGDELYDEILEPQNLDFLYEVYGKDKVDSRLYTILTRDFEKAVYSGDKKKIKMLTKKARKIPFISSQALKIYKKLLKAKAHNDYNAFASLSQKYFQKLKNDAVKREFIKYLYGKTVGGKSVDALSLQLSEALAKQNPGFDNNVLLIEIAVLNGEYDKARPLINEAIGIAKKNKDFSTKLKLKRFRKFMYRNKIKRQ